MPNFYQHNGTSYVHVSDYEALEVNALRELAAAQTAYVARGMELRDAEARLAEAEALLRKARRKILDIDGMTTSQFVDEGIGLSGLDLLKGIDAFLAPDSASVPNRASDEAI